MKKILAITGLCALLSAPAFAQTTTEAEEPDTPPTAEEIDEAAATVTAVAGNKAQAEGYCAIMKEIEAVPEGDEEAANTLGEKMDAYLAGLGEDIADAFEVVDAVEEASPDYAKVDEAFGKLEEACGS
jgi:hypothetical protein